MYKLYQVVPWFNRKEWYAVYEKLFSIDSIIDHKKDALNILLIWKARCPSIPSAIESTLCLLEVYIRDLEEHNDDFSDQMLRLAYATALMRFVNHMLDKETSKGSSLYKAAKNMGVPDWIIELRHDTAHSNKLPSIDLLREATIECLDWLKLNYWDKYKDSISDYLVGTLKPNTAKENKIASLLHFCTCLSIVSQSKCNIKNVSQIPDATMKESLVKDALELFGNDIDFSDLKEVSIIGLSNLMYQKAKKLLNDKSIQYVNKALLSEDSLILSVEVYNVFSNVSNKKRKPLNKYYVQCFEGLLNFLHTQDLLQDFIEELINITSTHPDSTRCRFAAQWTSTILKSLKGCQQFIEKMSLSQSGNIMSKDEEELRSLYYHWYPNEKNSCLYLNLCKPLPKNLTDIKYVQAVISIYNPYLIYFVSDLLLLVRPRIPKIIMEKICKIAYLIATPENFSIVSPKIYTAEDIKMKPDNFSDSVIDLETEEGMMKLSKDDMEIEETVVENKHALTNIVGCGIWKLAEKDYAWSSCPIGMLPW